MSNVTELFPAQSTKEPAGRHLRAALLLRRYAESGNLSTAEIDFSEFQNVPLSGGSISELRDRLEELMLRLSRYDFGIDPD